VRLGHYGRQYQRNRVTLHIQPVKIFFLLVLSLVGAESRPGEREDQTKSFFIRSSNHDCR